MKRKSRLAAIRPKKKKQTSKKPTMTSVNALDASVELAPRSSGPASGLDFTYDIVAKEYQQDENKRIAIICAYQSLGCPQEEYWHGRGGTISILAAMLEPITQKQRPETIERVLKNFMYCVDKSITYQGGRKEGSGRVPNLTIDSDDGQFVINLIEGGYGYRMATVTLNAKRIKERKLIVGPSSVLSLIQSLDHQSVPIVKLKQGNTDPTAAWSRARLNWCKQLAIRKNLIPSKVDVEHPEWFDINKLHPLNVNQICYWDEMHRKCVIGEESQSGERKIFYRDESGKVVKDKSQGKLTAAPTVLNVKFTQEARYGFGCSLVKLPDGSVQGRRAIPYVYSGQWICSISDFKEAEAAEMIRVKSLASGSWCSQARAKASTRVYQEDSVSWLKGVGGKLLSKLESCGVVKVSHLVNLSPASFKNTMKECGIGAKKMTDLCNLASKSPAGSYPESTDYRKAENPYQARYGDAWKSKIKEAIKGKVCITDFVKHMMEETDRMMADTVHCEDWMVYHDALSLMTDNSCREWMKTQTIRGKTYYERWVLPENGLNDTAELKLYKGRPVGNSPEMMPWDCSLNKDILDSMNRHVLITKDLPEEDERKFSLSTPARIDSCIRRLVFPSSAILTSGIDIGVPSAKRIAQDVLKCFGQNILDIIAAQGATVQGLGDRKGVRFAKKGGHGGRRPANAILKEEPWLHEDARQCNLLFMQVVNRSLPL
jgi:hypothetical protein